jgi:hypothetical protein
MKQIDMLKEILEMCFAEAKIQRGHSGKPASEEETDEFYALLNRVLNRPFEPD